MPTLAAYYAPSNRANRPEYKRCYEGCSRCIGPCRDHCRATQYSSDDCHWLMDYDVEVGCYYEEDRQKNNCG